jgi:hypothetical protein
MAAMARIKYIASLGILAVLCAGAGQTQEKKVDVTPVKYDGLKQEVLKQRGKVLVVDFWSGT